MKDKLKFIFRILKSNRLCAVIGIVGLGLGLACTILIAKYIWSEYTSNQFQKNYDRLYYCISYSSRTSQARVSSIINWSKEITDYPEVEHATEIQMHSDALLEYNRHTFQATIFGVDSSYYRVFSFRMKQGQSETALTGLSDMVVTESFARRIFGQENPMGKEVVYQGIVYTVTGVAEDWPANSSFHFDVLLPSRVYFGKMGIGFLTLKKGTHIRDVNEKLLKEQFGGFQKFEYEYRPFRDLYFNTEVDIHDSVRTGDAHSLFILGLIGSVILVISLFNYVNIYQVSLLGRNRELGVKKVFGENSGLLFFNFWMENLVMTFIALVLAVGIVLGVSPWIGQELNMPIRLNARFDVSLLAVILCLLPLLTSIWPYCKFSRILPAMVIRNTITDPKGNFYRKGLLIAQYVMTLVMLIVAFYFIRQLNFMLNREIGIREDHILLVDFFKRKELYFDLDKEDMEVVRQAYREKNEKHSRDVQYVENELRNSPYIQDFCTGNSPFKTFGHPWKNKTGERDYETCGTLSLTPGFEKLYGLEIVQGRFFDREQDRSRQNKAVINEAAMRWLGVNTIEDLGLLNNYWGGPWQVIGVVKDYHYEHLTKPVHPLVLLFFDDNEDVPYMIRVTPGKEKETLNFLRQVFEKVNPEETFSYHFLEDEIGQMYQNDRKLVRIASLFTFIAIFISSMGLFGFVVFDIRRRFKEIGVRKVNGATSGEVVGLLIWQFLNIVVVSFVIAVPVAWFILNKYTENFAERAPFSWWIFGGAALLTGTIAFLTVCRLSYRASAGNPVNALKNE